MPMTRSFIAATALALCLGACQSYHGMGEIAGIPLSSSGFKEEKGPGDLIKVEYHGTPFLSLYRTELFAMYRCAEVAQRAGKPYFALYQTLPDALAGQSSAKNKASTVTGVPYSYAYIRLHDAAGSGLLSTQEVLTRLTPLIQGDAGK